MYIDVNGVHAYYEVAGEGAPVLLLHGWMANIEAMRPIANAIVGMGMRAISLDFPGFGGKTDEPPEAWGVEGYAHFTKCFMEQLGITGADVVCHSYGGRVVLYLASEHPKLFYRLVLIDAAGIRPKRTLKWYMRTGTYKVGKRLKKIKFFDRLLGLSKKQASVGSEEYRDIKTDVMRGVFVKSVNLDLSDRLRRIGNATLLIWGDKDDSTPLYMARKMEKEIPDAGLVILEGAGHFSYADRYPLFCAVLRTFLQATTDE